MLKISSLYLVFFESTDIGTDLIFYITFLFLKQKDDWIGFVNCHYMTSLDIFFVHGQVYCGRLSSHQTNCCSQRSANRCQGKCYNSVTALLQLYFFLPRDNYIDQTAYLCHKQMMKKDESQNCRCYYDCVENIENLGIPKYKKTKVVKPFYSS